MLGIRIHRDEFHAPDILSDHAGYGVAAGAAKADNFDFSWAGNITGLWHFSSPSIYTLFVTVYRNILNNWSQKRRAPVDWIGHF
jgi:hypothetical protein